LSPPDEAASAPEISVVIPTLGSYAVLKRVLDAFDAQDAPAGSFELIVVADKADPEPESVDEAIGARPYPVRRLTGDIPGASANRNAGRRAARAPLLLLTDNDTIPTPSVVSRHLAWHASFPAEEVAVVGHVRWARELRLTPFMRWLEHGVQFDFKSIRGTEAGWAHLYSANSSLKRSFIERVGDFDELRLPYLYEDIDWAYRARTHGLRVLYNRDAVVDHYRTDATLDAWKQKMARSAQTERQFVALHPEVRPWFHAMFTDALKHPASRGRGVPLLGRVPRGVPWLGPAVWTSADLYFRQALAPYFLDAWERAEPIEPAPGELSGGASGSPGV
jgi:GT2 family glycosyltransferase